MPHAVTGHMTRRGLLRMGGSCVAGFTLDELLRCQAQGKGSSPTSPKSVIMIWLEGGPSHLDMVDLKPRAPIEFRGPYTPIPTKVPGVEICELLPRLATIADRFSIVRNMVFQNNDHRPPEELLTGFQGQKRPALGSVISRLESDVRHPRRLPPYVQLDSLHDPVERLSFPAFLGAAHKPFSPGKNLKVLELNREIDAARLNDRERLLRGIDILPRELDDQIAGVDAFTAQALRMITSPQARDAFDTTREPEQIRRRYGSATQLLQARRLVEAGVKVVSVSFIGADQGRKEACGYGGGTWDTHGNLEKCMGFLLPQFDQALYALITDLDERGLINDVAVVVWGEMGREPKITPNPGRAPGRGHWPQAGFAMLFGGGMKAGHVVGATDRIGGSPVGSHYTPQNVLATLYRTLGIDPGMTLNDHHGRPMHLLDDRRPIAELV